MNWQFSLVLTHRRVKLTIVSNFLMISLFVWIAVGEINDTCCPEKHKNMSKLGLGDIFSLSLKITVPDWHCSSLVFLDFRFGPSLRKKSGLFLGLEKWGIYARTRLGIVLGTPVIYNAPYKSHPMHKENKFRQY